MNTARFLHGRDAKSFLEEFNSKAREMYGENSRRVLVLTYDPKSKIVRGCNPFAVIHADTIGKSRGVRVATMTDLENTLVTDALRLRGTYEDTALVFRNSRPPNGHLARNLKEQFKARGDKLKRVPVIIQLRGLQIVADDDSDYGLAFKLNDESEIVEAPYLVERNDTKSFAKLDETGAPIFTNDGNRTLYTRKSGLSRLYLGSNLHIESGDPNLASSYDDGRLVLVHQD